MAPHEKTLDTAIRKKGSELRARRQRIGWIGSAAASYSVDVAFLALFAAAGTIESWIALGYGAAAAVLTLGVYAALSQTWVQRLKDPGLVAQQCLAAIVLQLAVVALAPQIAFPYLANLLTVFAFSMIWLPVRTSILLWAAASVLCGMLLFHLAGRVAVPTGTRFEQALVWLFFCAVLGRCVFLSTYAAGMRTRVAESRARLAETTEKLRELATRDELTAALNRRSLIARLGEEKARASRAGGAFSVALLDIDHFKRVNDTYGHLAGDEVLRRVTRLAHDTMRGTDVFGRYGGEEFMMIFMGGGQDAAFGALERVRRAVEKALWIDVVPAHPVTFSCGVSQYRAGETIEQLLNRADAALYEAKRTGRNRTCAA